MSSLDLSTRPCVYLVYGDDCLCVRIIGTTSEPIRMYRLDSHRNNLLEIENREIDVPLHLKL